MRCNPLTQAHTRTHKIVSNTHSAAHIVGQLGYEEEEEEEVKWEAAHSQIVGQELRERRVAAAGGC